VIRGLVFLRGLRALCVNRTWQACAGRHWNHSRLQIQPSRSSASCRTSPTRVRRSRPRRRSTCPIRSLASIRVEPIVALRHE